MEDEQLSTEYFLNELREISNKRSKRFNSKITPSTTKMVQGINDIEINGENMAAQFLNQYAEDSDLNQYWYSEGTIQVYCNAILEAISTSDCKNVAFLSTPSLYFALPLHARANSFLFDVSGNHTNPLPRILKVISV